jgi:hypothetical protein
MANVDLPSFLTPLKTYRAVLPPRQMTLDATGGAAAAPAQKILSNVSMTGQEQSNWCWSAVTQAVKRWSGKAVSQTDVASAHMSHNGRPISCASPHESDANGADCASGGNCAAICNDPHILSVVLGENELFRRYISQGAAPKFNDIMACINANEPAPCRVQWSTGGGHFILVIGWTVDNTGAQLVHVLDPASAGAGEAVPERVLGFTQFTQSYTLSGVSGAINYCYEV